MKSTPVTPRNSSTQIASITNECHSPLGIANGYIITRPPYRPGDHITYLCSTGFFMTGSPTLKCSTMFTWLGSPPHCDPIDFAPKVFNNNSEFTQGRHVFLFLFYFISFYLLTRLDQNFIKKTVKK